jgi:NAD(P)-dependent dehydrogenase (short-subunit alcohol dehydrogenase family)
VQALRPFGIRVSVLEPGYVDTPMVKDVPGDHNLFIQPDDLAQAALLPFLMKSATPLEIVLRLGYPVD